MIGVGVNIYVCQHEQGKVIGVGVNIYVCQHEQGKVIGVGVNIYVCSWKEKILNHTLAIDSQFQIFAVGLLFEFIDYLYYCFLQKCFPRRVIQGIPYIMCTLLYLSGWMTQSPAQMHRKVSSFSKLELASEKGQNPCKLGKNVNMRSSALEKVRH